jgi:hypothetical protein
MQAQSFAVPSGNECMDWSTCSLSQGNRTNWLTGKLDMHTISDLSQDLLNHWDNNYPASVFKPCKVFQGVNVNPSANRKIEKNDFQWLPLIQKLVENFETLFPHLAIEQVWPLWKSKDGDCFQGWHQDMVEHVTNTIVINLGSEDNSDELAADEGLQASTTNELDNDTERETLVDDHDLNVHTDNTVCDLLRSTAIQMKN